MSARYTPGTLALLLALLIGPAPAAAQWVEAPGSGWLQLVGYYLDTERQFGPDGERRDFFGDGHARALSVFATAAVGVVRGVDAWVQVPFHHLEFDDVAGQRTRTGIGDTRLHVRIGPELFGLPAVPVAVRGGVKLPVGDFNVDSEIIPLGDGQRDAELILEAGRSFHPLPLYAMIWVGQRWRGPNEEAAWQPGDEQFVLAAAGGELAGLTWKLTAEGLWGAPPVIQGVAVPNDSRRLIQLLPTVGYPLGPGAVEIGARMPLSGRNLPAGTAVSAGYFVSWD